MQDKCTRLKRTQSIVQGANHCDFRYALFDEPSVVVFKPRCTKRQLGKAKKALRRGQLGVISVGRCSRNELPSMLPFWCLGRYFGSLPICRRDTMMRIGLGPRNRPHGTRLVEIEPT